MVTTKVKLLRDTVVALPLELAKHIVERGHGIYDELDAAISACADDVPVTETVDTETETDG